MGRDHGRGRALLQELRVTVQRVEAVGVEYERNRNFGDEASHRLGGLGVRTEPRAHDDCGKALERELQDLVGERALTRRRQCLGDHFASRRRARGRATGNTAPDDARTGAHRRVTHQQRCADHPARPADHQHAGSPLVRVGGPGRDQRSDVGALDNP